LLPNQCNIQELALRVILKLKFADVSVIDTYRVIGGIIHFFFNLAFPGYKWSISHPGLFYYSAKNRIHPLRRRLSEPGSLEEEKCLVSLTVFKPRTFQTVAWLLYTLSYTAFSRERLSKNTNSRRTCADLPTARHGCQTGYIKLFSVMRVTEFVFVFP